MELAYIGTFMTTCEWKDLSVGKESLWLGARDLIFLHCSETN